jgi:hypothetical protein
VFPPFFFAKSVAKGRISPILESRPDQKTVPSLGPTSREAILESDGQSEGLEDCLTPLRWSIVTAEEDPLAPLPVVAGALLPPEDRTSISNVKSSSRGYGSLIMRSESAAKLSRTAISTLVSVTTMGAAKICVTKLKLRRRRQREAVISIEGVIFMARRIRAYVSSWVFSETGVRVARRKKKCLRMQIDGGGRQQ